MSIRKTLSSVNGWLRIGIILSVLFGLVVFLHQSSRHSISPPAEALIPFSLSGFHRLLVLAPHCDDETLGSAGLILAAERMGIEVRVVIATNGDGYLFATMQDFHRVYPRPADFIRMGNLRQTESLAALHLLGVQADKVSFLSYPDRGLPALWNNHWSATNPYRSPFSEDTQSPYALTYNPRSVYAGEDLLADLTSLLENFRPDLVVYPHADDVHPDHWGLNVFTRLAITLLKHRDPSFQPLELTYLVHRPGFPVIKGLRTNENLNPPSSLFSISRNWLRWDLTESDTTLKGMAIQQYRSQLPLLRGLMESFIRRNELFAPVLPATLPVAAQGKPSDPSSWKDSSGKSISPIQLDPKLDFFVRDALPSSDLVALFVAQGNEGKLWVCGQLTDEASMEVTYSLRLKALDENGLTHYIASTHPRSGNAQKAERAGFYFCSQADLAQLGHPWAIFAAAESQGPRDYVLDQTAWQMIYTQPKVNP